MVSLVCKLVGKLLTGFLRKMDLNWLNRLLGGVFGALASALLVSLLLNLLTFVDPYYEVIRSEAKTQSKLYTPTLRIASVAKKQLETYLPEIEPAEEENRQETHTEE